MEIVKFIIPGNPKGKGRPRVVGKKNGKGVVAFTPDSTRKYEDIVRWSYLVAKGRKLEGPIKLEIDAYFDFPKTLPESEKRDGWQQKKPDWDNIGKIVCDGLNGLAWEDDCEISDARVRKFYEAGNPRVEVTITELRDDFISMKTP